MVEIMARLKISILLGAMALCVWPAAHVQAQSDQQVIDNWLRTNAGLRTIRIDFEQTRTLKTVKMPIKQTGILWIDYPKNHYRWQTGDPPQTLVTSNGKEVVIIRAPKQRFERRPVGAGDSTGMEAMAQGFPRSLGEFYEKYHLLGIRREPDRYHIDAQPLGKASRAVARMTFTVETGRFRLLGLEMAMTDSSLINMVFTNVQLNPNIPTGLFYPDITGHTETHFNR